MSHDETRPASLLLIGVGGIGCELAEQCPAERHLLDFDARALARYDASETICLLGDADDTDVLVGAVGGQTGAIVLPTLARELKDADVRTVAVAVEPFAFEGAARSEMAERALGQLEQAADLLLTVPNRPLPEVCDASLPVNESLQSLKAKTAVALAQLLETLADGSCVGLHPAQMRRSLADAGRGAFGVGVSSGSRRPSATPAPTRSSRRKPASRPPRRSSTCAAARASASRTCTPPPSSWPISSDRRPSRSG